MASSTITYPWPSAVNVSNFIFTKLWFNYPDTNYEIWKEQMLCLIKGQDLLGFIDGSVQPPPRETQQENYVLWRRSDQLLKGWILASLNETLASQVVVAFNTARDVWWELETQFLELTQTLHQQQNTSANSKPIIISGNLMPFLPCKIIARGPWPSIIYAANFMSTELWFNYPNTNYDIWKQQMLCLIEDQDLLRFIDGSVLPPQPQTQYEDYLLWRRSNRLLKLRILGSLYENLVPEVAAMTTARDVWLKLENKFSELTESLRIQQLGQYRDLIEYVPLHKAALRGDWETAKRFLDQDPRVVINDYNMTPLHLAAGTENSVHLVQKMVEMMPDDVIAQTNGGGETALHIAASVGNLKAATILVNRKPTLLYVQYPLKGAPTFPIQTASLYGQKRMVEYLISVTTEQIAYDGFSGLQLLISLIQAGIFDIALELVIQHPYLAELRYPNGFTALSALAIRKKTPIQGGRFFAFWGRFIPIGRIKLDQQMMLNQKAQSLALELIKQMESMSYNEAAKIYLPAMFDAARADNSHMVEMVVEAFPDALERSTADDGRSLFHVAVENRSHSVFNLLYQMGGYKHRCVNFADKYQNTLLHAAAMLGPSHKLNQISGAALQMQRELQWYKEVEKLIQPRYRIQINNAGKISRLLFTEEHKQLKEEGEKWMKDTSASFTIAAALIATIMFAAAITVPGDYDNTTGFPTFSRDGGFIVFGISDVISLFTSTTSLLVFLSILTSRYAEEDFFYALPKRLIIGLGTLFLSVIFMMVAFSVTIYLVFGQKKAWVLIPVAALACLPVFYICSITVPTSCRLDFFHIWSGSFRKTKRSSFLCIIIQDAAQNFLSVNPFKFHYLR